MLRHRKGQPSDGEVHSGGLWSILIWEEGGHPVGGAAHYMRRRINKKPPLPPITFISSDINIANHMSQNEGGSSNRKRTLIISDSIMTNIE